MVITTNIKSKIEEVPINKAYSRRFLLDLSNDNIYK